MLEKGIPERHDLKMHRPLTIQTEEAVAYDLQRTSNLCAKGYDWQTPTPVETVIPHWKVMTHRQRLMQTAAGRRMMSSTHLQKKISERQLSKELIMDGSLCVESHEFNNMEVTLGYGLSNVQHHEVKEGEPLEIRAPPKKPSGISGNDFGPGLGQHRLMTDRYDSEDDEKERSLEHEEKKEEENLLKNSPMRHFEHDGMDGTQRRIPCRKPPDDIIGFWFSGQSIKTQKKRLRARKERPAEFGLMIPTASKPTFTDATFRLFNTKDIDGMARLAFGKNRWYDLETELGALPAMLEDAFGTSYPDCGIHPAAPMTAAIWHKLMKGYDVNDWLRQAPAVRVASFIVALYELEDDYCLLFRQLTHAKGMTALMRRLHIIKNATRKFITLNATTRVPCLRNYSERLYDILMDTTSLIQAFDETPKWNSDKVVLKHGPADVALQWYRELGLMKPGTDTWKMTEEFRTDYEKSLKVKYMDRRDDSIKWPYKSYEECLLARTDIPAPKPDGEIAITSYLIPDSTKELGTLFHTYRINTMNVVHNLLLKKKVEPPLGRHRRHRISGRDLPNEKIRSFRSTATNPKIFQNRAQVWEAEFIIKNQSEWPEELRDTLVQVPFEFRDDSGSSYIGDYFKDDRYRRWARRKPHEAELRTPGEFGEFREEEPEEVASRGTVEEAAAKSQEERPAPEYDAFSDDDESDFDPRAPMGENMQKGVRMATLLAKFDHIMVHRLLKIPQMPYDIIINRLLGELNSDGTPSTFCDEKRFFYQKFRKFAKGKKLEDSLFDIDLEQFRGLGKVKEFAPNPLRQVFIRHGAEVLLKELEDLQQLQREWEETRQNQGIGSDVSLSTYQSERGGSVEHVYSSDADIVEDSEQKREEEEEEPEES